MDKLFARMFKKAAPHKRKHLIAVSEHDFIKTISEIAYNLLHEGLAVYKDKLAIYKSINKY